MKSINERKSVISSLLGAIKIHSPSYGVLRCSKCARNELFFIQSAKMSNTQGAKSSIAEKSFNQRNPSILYGINLGHQGAQIFKKITILALNLQFYR